MLCITHELSNWLMFFFSGFFEGLLFGFVNKEIYVGIFISPWDKSLNFIDWIQKIKELKRWRINSVPFSPLIYVLYSELKHNKILESKITELEKLLK